MHSKQYHQPEEAVSMGVPFLVLLIEIHAVNNIEIHLQVSRTPLSMSD
jgi:hypothetical protein